MKSLFKFLNKRKWSSILTVLLLALLLSGCSGSSGGGGGESPQDESYKLEVKDLFATWASISFCSVDEMETLYKYEFKLYKGDSTEPLYTRTCYDDTDFYIAVCASSSSTKPLEPDTNYTIKATYTKKSNYDTFEKTLNFKTKKYDFSDYSITYDSSFWKCICIESSELPYETLKIYRSESADGEYEELDLDNRSSYYIQYHDEDNLAPNKTYYYKFAITKYNSTTQKYDVLFANEQPKSITLGLIPPSQVVENTIKVYQGITAVKFEWEPVPGANSYRINVKENSYSSSAAVIDTKTVTDSVYEFEAAKCLSTLGNSTSYKVYIYAVNDSGESDYVTKTFRIVEPEVKAVQVSAGQKEAIYRYTTNFDYAGPGCTVEYILSSKFLADELSEENDIYLTSNTPEIRRTGLNIFTEYKYGSDKGYAFVRAKYKDKDNNEQTIISTSTSIDNFTTEEFDTVTGLEIVSVNSTSITYKFTPLTSEQKNGQNVYYYVRANSLTPEKINNPSAATQTIDHLSSGMNYTLKIIATNDSYVDSYDFAKYKNVAEIEAVTDSGLSKPRNVTLSEEAGSVDIQPLLNVTWDKIAEDDSTGNVAYEVEYKILKKSAFKKFFHKVGDDYVSEYINTYTASLPVNAGNRYFVRVVAYKVSEPACKVYSDTEVIQLEKYDDKTLVTALTYPANIGSHLLGDVIDFTDPNVWEGNIIPRSTLTTGYHFGLTSFMGEASNDRIQIPTGNPEYFAFKVSLDSETDENEWGINSTYNPRLIFIDDYAFFTPGEKQGFGQFENIFIVKPDTDGWILKEYPEPSGYLFSDINMPYFNKDNNGNLTSTTSAASAGIAVDESWIYNNSVYIGVKQDVAGLLGFSYFY